MVSILDFGAIADGATLNTTAIQKAIDSTAAQGGGRVVVPAGIFVTGTLRLQDNIDLHLEPGAVLVASKNMDDYNPPDEYPQNWGSTVEQWRGAHLIIAIGRKNVSITGRGTIDGSGDFFFEPPAKRPLRHNYAWAWGFRVSRDKEMLRPGQMLVFCECQNVLVSGITIRNSPCWCCYLIGCQDAVVEKLVIRNPPDAANTDGIDIDCCQNVMVSNCNIETGDDAITLRGHERVLCGKHSPCENVTITNCVLGCSVCAFRIGVGSGIIRNVAISNIAIRRSARGFLVQSAYSSKIGVDIYDISISNIRFDNTACPVKIDAGSPETTATIHDISFDGLRGNCYANIQVIGQEITQPHPHDIWFTNCRFHVVKPPVRLADQKDYPSHFLSITRAERIFAQNVHFDRDEEAASFWN